MVFDCKIIHHLLIWWRIALSQAESSNLIFHDDILKKNAIYSGTECQIRHKWLEKANLIDSIECSEWVCMVWLTRFKRRIECWLNVKMMTEFLLHWLIDWFNDWLIIWKIVNIYSIMSESFKAHMSRSSSSFLLHFQLDVFCLFVKIIMFFCCCCSFCLFLLCWF